MELWVIILGEEAGYYITVKRLEEKRREIEKIPPPVKKNHFDQWVKDLEDRLRADIKQTIKRQAENAYRSIATMASEKQAIEDFQYALDIAMPKLMLLSIQAQYLPLIHEVLEEAAFAKERSPWDNRFSEIDNELTRARGQIPKPFAINLVNIDRRFPLERIGMQDGRYFDKWLTEGLKSKEPIFFDPQEEYVQSLMRAYEEIYWKAARERK